jgi:hypothetical protein
MSIEQMRFAKRISKKSKICPRFKCIDWLSVCPLRTHAAKGKVQGFWANSPKNLASEQFKNAIKPLLLMRF